MSRRLVVDDGLRERELLLVANIVVGRDPMCDVSDDNDLLSRRHAEFVVRPESVSVRDLGSRNGVYVNGRRTADGKLRPDDQVQIGNLKLRFVEDDAPLPTEIQDDDPNLTVAWTVDDDLLGANAAGQSEAGPEPGATAQRAPGSWSLFLFTRVALLSLVVSLASVAVTRRAGGSDVTSVALLLAIVVVATGLAWAMINHRITRALAALNLDLERAERGGIVHVSDPLGAKATRDLAATVNRLLAKRRAPAAQPAEQVTNL